MKKFLNEFKEFALQGNVVSMAVGIIIGSAFTAIVNSLVDDILNPLLGLLVRNDFSNMKAEILGVNFMYGNFIMAVINFVLVALVLFMIIRAMNKVTSMTAKKEEPAAPDTKECPYCKSTISIEATRCPNCTSNLD